MNARPWLAPGLSSTDRVSMLLDAIYAAGYRVVEGSGRYSRTNPVTRTITLRNGLSLAPASPDLVAVLAHELEHARRFGPRWLPGVGRGLLYLVSGVRRLCWEIEAEAQETAARHACTGGWELTADSLSGWHRPYFTGATRAVVEAAVMGLARRAGG